MKFLIILFAVFLFVSSNAADTKSLELKSEVAKEIISASNKLVNNKNVPDPKHLVQKITSYQWEKSTIGIVAMVLGTILCFSGSLYIKFFISVGGFAVGAILGLRSLDLVDLIWKIPEDQIKLSTYVIIFLAGFLAAGMAFWFLKWGMIVVAGCAGYVGSGALISIPVLSKYVVYVNHHTILAIGTITAIVLVIFFRDFVLLVCSAVIGGIAIIVGSDILSGGVFKDQLFATLTSHKLTMIEQDNHAYYLFSLMLGIIVAGIVAQLIFIPRRKD